MPARPHAALLLAIVACIVASGCGRETHRQAVAIGEPFPEYRAVSLAGDSVSLAALRGRVVLLNVWSVWCAPCRAEIAVLEELRARHERAGLEIVGLNVDGRGDTGTVERFVRASPIHYAVWRDADDSLPGRTPTDGVPATYVIGRDGRLLWAHLGALRRDDPELRDVLAGTLASPDVPLRGATSACCNVRSIVRPAAENRAFPVPLAVARTLLHGGMEDRTQLSAAAYVHP